MSEDGLVAAVAAARKDIGVLPKDATNPHFGSSFTSLGKLIERSDPALADHDLSWLTKPVVLGERPALYYRLLHTPSGEEEEGTMILFGVEHMQGLGSALTYGRRYALTTVLHLVGEDDDDGNASVAQAVPQAADAVNLTDLAKGLSDEALNAVLEAVGSTPREKPWGTFIRIPAAYADATREALQAAHAAEGR